MRDKAKPATFTRPVRPTMTWYGESEPWKTDFDCAWGRAWQTRAAMLNAPRLLNDWRWEPRTPR